MLLSSKVAIDSGFNAEPVALLSTVAKPMAWVKGCAVCTA